MYAELNACMRKTFGCKVYAFWVHVYGSVGCKVCGSRVQSIWILLGACLCLLTHSGTGKSESCGQMRCSDRNTRTSRLNSRWATLEDNHMRRWGARWETTLNQFRRCRRRSYNTSRLDYFWGNLGRVLVAFLDPCGCHGSGPARWQPKVAIWESWWCRDRVAFAVHLQIISHSSLQIN